MKKVLFILLAVVSVTVSSCSKYAKKDDIKVLMIENLDLTISPNDWTWNSTYDQWEYKISHSYLNNDALVGFVMSGNGKEALPYFNMFDGTIVGLTDVSFSGYLMVTYYDGNSDLPRPSSDKYVYLKIIPSGLKKPNVNYTDFKEVRKAHNF